MSGFQPSPGEYTDCLGLGLVMMKLALVCTWVWLVTSGQSGWVWPRRLAQKWGPRDSGTQWKVPHQALTAQLLSEFTQCLFGRDIRRREGPS